MTAEMVAILTMIFAVATASAVFTAISTSFAISAVYLEILGHGTSG